MFVDPINMNRFTGLYQQNKVLKFELRPVGETLEHIKKDGIIETDTALAASYAKMKKSLDEYHKDFIDESLMDVVLEGLEEFYELYTATKEERMDKKFRDKFDAVKSRLRMSVSAAFEANPRFTILNSAELIKKELKPWIQAHNPSLHFDARFHHFTTYFVGYNTIRMNLYTPDNKASSIAFRLIDENLPIFIDNMHVFERVQVTDVADNFDQLCRELEAWLNVPSLAELFSLQSYNELLTQAQIDAYNTIIGGRSDGEVKYRGLNEYINQYNQTHDNKLPLMKKLRKMLLSDRMSASWLPDSFLNAEQVMTAVRDFYQELDSSNIFGDIKTVLADLPNRNPAGIYVRNGSAISDLSKNLFGSYSVIRDALAFYYSEVVDPDYQKKLEKAKSSSAREKLEAAKQKFVGGSSFHSIQTLQMAVDVYMMSLSTEDNKKLLNSYYPNCILDYWVKCVSWGGTDYALASRAAYKAIESDLTRERTADENLSQSEKNGIKALLDNILAFVHAVKPLYITVRDDISDVPDRDEVFYASFQPLFECLDGTAKLYDKVRNFATKKPFSTDKVKLNFGAPTLLSGWSESKEKVSLGLLFCKDGNYYLGIMNGAHRKIFDEIPEVVGGAECYRKVCYNLLAGPNKMLPGVFFAKGNLDFYQPSQEILDIYKRGSFKKGSAFNLDDCHKLIDFFKECIAKRKEWDVFNFKFSDTRNYADISEFYREVAEQGYKLSFCDVPASYMDELVRDGKLYLFQIWNNDFSPYSKGKPKLHTLYWKALFDERNLSDVVYKLNGQAEIFFRKASIAEKDRVIHPAGQPIASKNPLRNKKSVFDYDIIKDRRYTVDKFLLHVPLTLNFKATGRDNINDKVCNYLKGNHDVNVLGINRGERHLLYITMIDRNGNVVKNKDGKPISYSLNTITSKYKDSDGNDVLFDTPYRTILDYREKERKEAQENWGVVDNIKDLKQGYLSQVVHHIVSLMVEYNAVLAMEDLDSGFKNSRIAVEKQVYQNFEKALIEKLNYLVLKDRDPEELGGLYHALQLTSKFEGFKNLRKQCGFIFYIPSWYTTNIDPVTGFIDMLRPRYKTIQDARLFFSRFDSIVYNKERGWFEFKFDYKRFPDRMVPEVAASTRSEWTLCTHGDLRYVWDPKKNGGAGGSEKWDVTGKLKALFTKFGIDYEVGDLISAILAQTSAEFFSGLMRNLQVLLDMRYFFPEEGEYLIISPVADKAGMFFCGNAAANGALGIARKGLMVLERIDEAESYKDWSTRISNKDWLDFVQTRGQ